MLTKRDSKRTVHTYTVTVELEDKIIDPEKVALRLAEGPCFMEGVGHIDVQYHGTLDTKGE